MDTSSNKKKKMTQQQRTTWTRTTETNNVLWATSNRNKNVNISSTTVVVAYCVMSLPTVLSDAVVLLRSYKRMYAVILKEEMRFKNISSKEIATRVGAAHSMQEEDEFSEIL